MVTGMVMVMGTVTAMDTGMVTGTIRMMRRRCVGRVGGRGFLGRRRDGTRDAGRGTNRFTIYDIRFTIEGLQAGLILNT